MKIRLNKKVLAEMDPRVRAIVQEWSQRYHRAFISVENRPSFYVHEDAKVTIINLLTGAAQTERVAGEFAGYTNLSPTATIPLPEGCVAIETYSFMGVSFLTIYQASKPQIT